MPIASGSKPIKYQFIYIQKLTSLPEEASGKTAAAVVVVDGDGLVLVLVVVFIADVPFGPRPNINDVALSASTYSTLPIMATKQRLRNRYNFSWMALALARLFAVIIFVTTQFLFIGVAIYYYYYVFICRLMSSEGGSVRSTLKPKSNKRNIGNNTGFCCYIWFVQKQAVSVRL